MLGLNLSLIFFNLITLYLTFFHTESKLTKIVYKRNLHAGDYCNELYQQNISQKSCKKSISYHIATYPVVDK